MLDKHQKIERHSMAMVILIIVVAAIGGLVEILPLFTIDETVEDVEGVRPYTPLELAGRNIYIREGCYLCHSQMVRSLRDEVERYGHYSLAAESMHDHPFQWGSKRTGPDLARVGGKYSNEWHVAHFINPQALVQGSIMPQYPFLAEHDLEVDDIVAHLETQRAVRVPYTEAMLANAEGDLAAQADPFGDHTSLLERYPKAAVGDFDGDPERLTEMDALIAYLQILGRMVDFDDYRTEDLLQ